MALIIQDKAYIRLSAKVDFDNKNIEVGIFPFETKADYDTNNVVPWLGQMLKLNPTHTFPYAKETVDILRFAHEKLVGWMTIDDTEPIMTDSGEKDAEGNPVMVETGRNITREKLCEAGEVVIAL